MQTAISEQVPATMKAAVYQGNSQVTVESITTPTAGPGELLIRVESCGICHTDLKKIEYNLLPGPRIYGHETAGVVAAVGAGVTRFAPGDRVLAFHHVPCSNCFYCQRKLYAQCPVYKKVGITAGFEPAGGGFAQYVRVMDWIVERGIERVPESVTFEEASFVEPVNTCLKAVVMADPQPADTVLVQGQGPIGLIFTRLIARTGSRVVTTDTMANRLALSRDFGAEMAWNPLETDVAAACRRLTDGRGVDQVFVAVSAPGVVETAMRASRPGAKVLLFSQTSEKERVEVAGSDICKDERTVFGSYSASIDLQRQSAELVFSGELRVRELISHRVGLRDINRGIELAMHPDALSLKIVVQPQRWA